MVSRRAFLQTSALAALSVGVLPNSWPLASPRVQLLVPCRLFDGKSCWAHPRGAIVSARGSGHVTFVMAMLDLRGNDIFPGMYGFETKDGGKTFSEPKKIDELSVALQEMDGGQYHVGMGDVVPMLHRPSGKVLATGMTLAYDANWKPVAPRPKRVTYAVYDAENGKWNAWKYLEVPDEWDYKATGAGCAQRVDLPDGRILLPVSLKKSAGNSGVAVMRCRFDGTVLSVEEKGNELFVPDNTRGLAEPSLIFFEGVYYMTVRHNERGYVTTSKDGLNFAPLRVWTFDDGADLGNYNTQQHWVSLRGRLYLVYTRRGANNDHVYRNRAPLFMAEVDPARLCVLRSTEISVLPNNGARYGNFGVCRFSDKESWITDSEWMQPKGCEKYGSEGRVWVAKVR